MPDLVPLVLIAAAAAWFGTERLRSTRLLAQLDERTQQLAAEEALFAELAVRRERARIARELHDIVAHHLAVVVVQAGAGRMAPAAPPAQTTTFLSSIRASSDQALAELARVVDVLHADGAVPPGRQRLATLVGRVAAGGVALDYVALPAGTVLPGVVEDLAYRVVQEALTNALKHAPGAAVVVRLSIAGSALEIDIRNDEPTEPSDLAETGSGSGLAGLRERVEEQEGAFQAGPCAAGGWRVRAEIPTAAPPQPGSWQTASTLCPSGSSTKAP